MNHAAIECVKLALLVAREREATASAALDVAREEWRRAVLKMSDAARAVAQAEALTREFCSGGDNESIYARLLQRDGQ